MPPADLSPQYDASSIEREIYDRWLNAGVFTAHADRSKRSGGPRDPFVIVIPPPNVTAVLHMGHGLNDTVQDVLVRWRRMAGDEALWVPGTDHAGIATQNVIEKQLAAEGKSKDDMGRDAFVKRTETFVAETGRTILKQLEAIGASCDWTRTAYTLSPALSRAVREAFVRLYEDGLIYKGHRVIHWCPRCLTALSDEEAEPVETDGRLYHISYPVAGDRQRTVEIATTRPETMFGDVAVAVNPDDERYTKLVGKRVVLPLVNIEIPVIADAYADPAFGTGVVKITPAHDANDFEVGLRHQLAMPVVIDETGAMNEGADAAGRVPPALRGADRFHARELTVAMLKEAGRLVKIEPHRHSVRHCYRCDTVVEPRLSDQWFVKMKPLAEPALAAVRDGTIRIAPERWHAVYVNWLEGIRDWNISRQLWWGHRIPVWYCDACGAEPIVSRADVLKCDKCGGAVRQDPDVLDTWFSSWLWPLSTLGWPDETKDLAAFYPTDVLVTAPEILFFWVARMIFAGFKFMGKAPFHTVYLHGTVRDMDHVKMSKSLGNGIDPLDVVRLYGADALRYTVIAGLGMGTDVMLDPNNLEASFAPGRNFATKLWNIGRFLLASVGELRTSTGDWRLSPATTRADEWILARLDVAIAECEYALGPARPSAGKWTEAQRTAGLRLSEFTEVARRFVWNEVADWYVETTKARIAAGGTDGDTARGVLVHVFDRALRLLHPVVPFITEALWQRLPGRVEGEFLATAEWPKRRGGSTQRAAEFELAREAVTAIRQVRADYNIPPGKLLDVVIIGQNSLANDVMIEESALIGRLARATITTQKAPEMPGRGGDNWAPSLLARVRVPEGSADMLLSDGSHVIVQLAGTIDVAKECAKASDELTQLEKQLLSLEQRLGNESFTARAKPEVVESERRKLGEWRTRREQLAAKKKALCGD